LNSVFIPSNNNKYIRKNKYFSEHFCVNQICIFVFL